MYKYLNGFAFLIFNMVHSWGMTEVKYNTIKWSNNYNNQDTHRKVGVLRGI